jgi:NAD(P)-dependent dehydrogenase (short-subunit alcohol dehydrogenase family)
MSFRLDGKSALITGAASGIGRASAIRFAEEGANVAVADRNLAAADETAAAVRKLGRKASAIQVDVSDPRRSLRCAQRPSRISAVSTFCWRRQASPTPATARAKSSTNLLHEIPFEEWRRLMAINLDGCFLTCQAAAQQMIAQGHGGRIIAIASGAAKIPIKGSGEYAVSKAGVWMLMKNMALELGRYDITCNAIGPGVIDTPMTKDLQESKNFDRMMRQAPLKRIGKPVDVANTALFLASEEGSYFTGSILHPDGGFVMQ